MRAPGSRSTTVPIARHRPAAAGPTCTAHSSLPLTRAAAALSCPPGTSFSTESRCQWWPANTGSGVGAGRSGAGQSARRPASTPSLSPRSCLIRRVELVIHESRDDAGFAHALVPQKDQFVLGQRGDRRGRHCAAGNTSRPRRPSVSRASRGAALQTRRRFFSRRRLEISLLEW